MTNCNCNCVHLVNSVTASTTELTLNFSPAPAVQNSDFFNFRIACDLGSNPTTYVPVVMNVSINGTTSPVPLLNRFGNQVYSNELRNRVVYRGYFGSVPTSHIIANNTPKNC